MPVYPPGDISVTGFNDMPFVDRLSPLTTIRIRTSWGGKRRDGWSVSNAGLTGTRNDPAARTDSSRVDGGLGCCTLKVVIPAQAGVSHCICIS